jgi:hypothetical protein
MLSRQVEAERLSELESGGLYDLLIRTCIIGYIFENIRRFQRRSQSVNGDSQTEPIYPKRKVKFSICPSMYESQFLLLM